MHKEQIVILGAGISGLSAAWYLQNKNTKCSVFEKEPEVGGLCRSKKINGFTFDYSGHPLHFKNSKAFNFVKNILAGSLVKHKRNAWVYSHGKFTPYPFQANLFGLPLPVVKECLEDFLMSCIDNKLSKQNSSKISFKKWAENIFGKGIAKDFLIPYNAKFWTLSADKLSCEWAENFIPIPSFRQVVEGAFGRGSNDLGYNSVFWYPKKGGINQLPQGLAGKIKNIHLNMRVKIIDIKRKNIIFESGESQRYEQLISTIPLPELVNMIKGLPIEILEAFKKLKWNSILNLNIGVDKKDILKRHWVYFPQKQISFFRVGSYHNFFTDIVPKNKSAYYVEMSYPQSKHINIKEAVKAMKKDLIKVGILQKTDKICAEDVNNIKYGYAIEDFNYKIAKEKITRYLKQFNISLCGRYGSWSYFSIEDSILNAKMVAESL